MTAIFYPDLEATSAGGAYKLEARSPHNGTTRHRDGRKVAEDEFAFQYRQHQSEFRYQLLARTPRGPLGRLLGGSDLRVVWERWQPDREDSPGELIVSDDGWAVIRTHGFRPEVIAVDPKGRDVVRVRVVYSGDEVYEDALDQQPPVYHWPLKNLCCSTAGNYWSGNSWRCFFTHDGRTHFSWRTWSGERLVFDPVRGYAFTDEGVPDALAAAAVAAERVGIVALLAELSPRLGDVRELLRRTDESESPDESLREQVWQAQSALHLVGVHRLKECIPRLREWEALDVPGSSTGSTAMPPGWRVQTQLFRPVVHHALKLLGEVPRGFPTYRFTTGEFANPEVFPMPEQLPDRTERAMHLASQRTAEELLRFGQDVSAEQVLQTLGSPDFIAHRSRQVQVGNVYRWSEDWEYDLNAGTAWSTLRLTWTEDNTGRVRLTAAAEVAPYWLENNDRELEYLRF